MNPEEHPTSNIQRRTSNDSANPRSLRRSVFDVGCSMFSIGSGLSTCESSPGSSPRPRSHAHDIPSPVCGATARNGAIKPLMPLTGTLLAFLGTLLLHADADAAGWKAGLAAAKITPEKPVPMAGYAS